MTGAFIVLPEVSKSLTLIIRTATKDYFIYQLICQLFFQLIVDLNKIYIYFFGKPQISNQNWNSLQIHSAKDLTIYSNN